MKKITKINDANYDVMIRLLGWNVYAKQNNLYGLSVRDIQKIDINMGNRLVKTVKQAYGVVPTCEIASLTGLSRYIVYDIGGRHNRVISS